ncbi:class I SAM-dependent methyltransferase [Streptomyces sp. NPDC003710]
MGQPGSHRSTSGRPPHHPGRTGRARTAAAAGRPLVSTAPYYARFRPGYDPALYDMLAERFALNGTQRILDLGIGTGVLALPLARLVGHVTAIDPEPGMLDEGRKLAAEQDIPNIDWVEGDSTTGSNGHRTPMPAPSDNRTWHRLSAEYLSAARGPHAHPETPRAWAETDTAMVSRLGPEPVLPRPSTAVA